ncbi:MAG: hypothetical protein KGH79_00585 [Patescibacteria group bacterium]|nr:hypothetical protein [Patescibacteria group bacterium]
MRTPAAIWIGIVIGSSIGGLIPELWDANIFSFSSIIFSAAGAFAGLWLGFKMTQL